MGITINQTYIEDTLNTNFLGVTLDSTLSWCSHIERISNKLKTACYVLRILKPTLTIQNLKIVYFAYFRSVMSYGIMLWGNATGSNIIFNFQKRAIRIMTNTNFNTSCRELFRDLCILNLHSQYILSLVMFVSEDMNDFTTNSDIHPCNTTNNNNLHLPLTRLTKYQKRSITQVLKPTIAYLLRSNNSQGNQKNSRRS